MRLLSKGPRKTAASDHELNILDIHSIGTRQPAYKVRYQITAAA